MDQSVRSPRGACAGGKGGRDQLERSLERSQFAQGEPLPALIDEKLEHIATDQ